MDLAIYASHPDQSRGRLVTEPECGTRSVFQRDRDRIIHSAAFRRLEYKTQVFINHEGDHYRTRLTHSLEVAQLSRSICRTLMLNEDIGEAVALAHDLGHTPFGHAGEDGLQEVMSPYGGFDHNAQALRILTSLEHRYATFDGLNLTWDTLEGIVKHNGPLPLTIEDGLPSTIDEYNRIHNLKLYSFASAEAQVAAIADDIAYNNHDIEDGIRAGFFSLDDLRNIATINEIIELVDNAHPTIDEQCRVHEVLRRIINRMVSELLRNSSRNIEIHRPQHVDEIRSLKQPIISFSHDTHQTNKQLKAFLKEKMYRHFRVNRMTSKAKKVVKELFLFFFEEPSCMPTHWQHRMSTLRDETERARVVCDFIAGMTDRFALLEYQRVFDMQSST